MDTSVLAAGDPTLAPHTTYDADGYIHVADRNEGCVLLRLMDQP